MPETYFTVNLNIGRNSIRHITDPAFRASEARKAVKFFLAPSDGTVAISDSMIPDVLVTDSMSERYLEIEPPEFCVAPDFQPIIDDIERAYVLGLHFSALSAACVMIERLINAVRIGLHRFHPDTFPDLKEKGPIDNWKKNIDALVAWEYLQEDSFTGDLRSLWYTRSKYLHAGPLDELKADAARSVCIAYALLKKFLGFPDELFEITSGIACKNLSHPIVQVFYIPHLTKK